MIIIKSSTYLTKMAEEQIRNNILEQRSSGIIVLQPYLEVVAVADDDTKLEFKLKKELEEELKIYKKALELACWDTMCNCLHDDYYNDLLQKARAEQ